MGLRLLVVLAMALTVLQAAAPLTFKVTPTEFKEDMPADLTLNCSMTYDPQQPLKPVSLALYHNGSTQPLVSIDYFKGNRVIPEGNCAGFINPRGESYLCHVMRGINQTAVGNYSCELQCMDQNANIVKKTSTQTVKGTVDTSTSTNPNSKTPSGSNGGSVDQYTQNLAKVVRGLMQLEDHLFYSPSPAFHAHTYHLSRIPFFDLDLAHQICKFVLDGYLVQIEDLKEHEKIKEYLKVQDSKVVKHNVLIGATEKQVGKLVQVNDDSIDASYLWGILAPGAERCVELGNGNWDPKRVDCIGDEARFLCEVE